MCASARVRVSHSRVRTRSCARARARLPTWMYTLAADSVEWIARVTRTRVHRAAFRRVYARTVKRWERKPRARFAATSAVARHSASEPVRLAGNRPTNGRLSRATLRSITRIDFPHGIYNDGLPFDSRQMLTDDEDSFVVRATKLEIAILKIART